MSFSREQLDTILIFFNLFPVSEAEKKICWKSLIESQTLSCQENALPTEDEVFFFMFDPMSTTR